MSHRTQAMCSVNRDCVPKKHIQIGNLQYRLPANLRCSSNAIHKYVLRTLQAYLTEQRNTMPHHPLAVLPRDRHGFVRVVAFKSRDTRGFYSQLKGPGRVGINLVLGAAPCKANEKLWGTNPSYCFWFVASEREVQRKLCKYTGRCPYYRLKQILGMNPNWKNTEMWTMIIRPEYLFRPCLYPGCQKKQAWWVTTAFRQWVREWHKNSYDFLSQSWAIPFGGMGYTIDWERKTPNAYGVSEFIVRPGSVVHVESILDLKDYRKTCRFYR